MKLKMSEAEQIERMKRNQERLANKRKPPVTAQRPQNQSSETKEEVSFNMSFSPDVSMNIGGIT